MTPSPHWPAQNSALRARSTLLTVLCVVGVSVLGVCAHPAPAIAAPKSIEYRVDGGAWRSDPPPLFSTDWVPVPGSSRTATLEIRNLRDTPTILAVHASQMHAGSAELSHATTLRSGDHSISFDAAEPCTTVAPQLVLHPGDTFSLPVTLSVGPELTASSQTALTFQLEVSLSDTGPRTHANGCPIDPVIVAAYPGVTAAAPPLANTGGHTPNPAGAAIALIGFGGLALWLGVARRRTTPRGSH